MAHSALRPRPTVTLLLLAVYGSVGILGYGLHDLWHVHHHQEAGVAETAGHSCCCSHHGHCHSPAVTESSRGCGDHPPGDFVAKSDSSREFPAAAGVDDPCPICELLTQAQERGLSVSTSSVVTNVPTLPPADEVLFPLYLPAEHLARGPPIG